MVAGTTQSPQRSFVQPSSPYINSYHRCVQDKSRGAHLYNLFSQCLWSCREHLLHINMLKLRAWLSGSQSVLPQVQKAVTYVAIDNTYVIFAQTERSSLVSIKQWVQTLGLLYPIQHLSNCLMCREHNKIADQLSRDSSQMYEWSLKESVIQNIFSHWHKSIHHPIQYEMPLLLLKSGFRKSIIDTRLFPW